MKFPVFQTTLEALEYCWRERRLGVRFAALPFVIGLILASAAQLTLGISTLSGQQMPPSTILMAAGLSALHMLVYAPLSVTWLRLTVLGEEAARGRRVFTFGQAERRFFGWQILCFFAAFGLVVVGSAITGLLFVFVEDKRDILGATVRFIVGAIDVAWTCFWIVGLLLAMMRVTMIFVLAALDQPVKFKIAWASTRGLSWRLLGATSLLVITSAIVNLTFNLVGRVLTAIFPSDSDTRMGSISAITSLIGSNAGGLVFWLTATTLYGIVHKMLVARNISDAGAIPPADDPAPTIALENP